MNKLRELFHSVALEPSRDDEYRDIAPWFVYDPSTAEPEVNWPGEYIAGPFDSYKEADEARWKEIDNRLKQYYGI